MKNWCPNSWIKYNYEQACEYPDPIQLQQVVRQLSKLPPLVLPEEINHLKTKIAAAGKGLAFILQGGDCAESFNDCQSNIIRNKLKILFQMGSIIEHKLRKPVIKIGRIAGQYTKPRSSLIETKNNITLPSYRGDLVNLPDFNEIARTPNPNFLLQGYNFAAITLNLIRALTNNQFWQRNFSANQLENNIPISQEFFVSHEALHLHYEQALTHRFSDNWYNLSTHLPWIGMRTGKVDEAHIEFIRGVQNPIGIKIGPNASCEWLQEVISILNPDKEYGRVLLITRLGKENITKLLPSFIAAVQRLKIPVTWSCDPMHGNTEFTKDGFKTRYFNKILAELELAVDIHKESNSILGGVHFELTGDNVTECIGGTVGITEVDLKHAYHSLVDPRLNYKQSVEMAEKISEKFAINKLVLDALEV